MNLLDSLIEDQLILPPLLNSNEQRREVWICIRTDGASGDGSRENPYNGSPSFDGSPPTPFDALMSDVTKISTNMTIRLGPGVFITRGGDGGAHFGPWRPKNGQRIIGSGMFVTTLQLIDAGTGVDGQNVGQNIVCNNSDVNNFEISDLTLDCNFARQPNPSGDPDDYNHVMLSGVGINGCNNRISRVRVINFGTGTGLECFPLWLAAGVTDPIDRGNSIIEDCIVELPNDDNGRETTCISSYSDPYYTSPGAGGVLRNCYVNCELANPRYPEHKVVSVTVAAPYIYLTTQWPHCLNTKDIIYVTGSLLSGNVRFTLDGTGTNSVEDYRTIKLTSGDIGLNGTVKLIGVRRNDNTDRLCFCQASTSKL